MNFQIPFLPKRATKPRHNGLTMMMDKGLSLREAENFVSSSAEYCDLVKFGFGTAVISNDLEAKIELYKQAGLKPYFGGTLFEAFIVRGMFAEYHQLIERYKLDLVEVSDGSMEMKHEEKLKYINILSEKVTVLSEVGSKQSGIVIPMENWISMMQSELKAGAWKVIAEARESGNIGIYNADGSANTTLIDDIVDEVGAENVLWEAPNKNQQVWFVKLLGANVNLGNIASNEVIPLETLRLGLRGDTFCEYLPEPLKEKKQK
jgi:phosphosulfolactate synthase